MPSIQITPEQANALARGENITVEHVGLTVIAVSKTGGVFTIYGAVRTDHGWYGEWERLRSPADSVYKMTSHVHQRAISFNDKEYTFVGVES